MAGYTLEQLEQLEKAIASGTLSVRHGDKAVQYQSLAEMRSVRAEMRRELGLDKPKRPRSSRAVFTWGD